MKRIRVYPQGGCANCHLSGRIIKNQLCYSCYQDQRVSILIHEIFQSFKPLNPYNQQLSKLYYSYITRYRLSYPLKNQLKHLLCVLEKEKITTIKSWQHIYCLSDSYLIYQPNSNAKGCAFIKIGKMLQELGVLPPREDEWDRQIKYQLDHFYIPDNVKQFSDSLIQTGLSKETVIQYLHALKQYNFWLFHYQKEKSLEQSSSENITKYIEILAQEKTVQFTRAAYNHIIKFYNWAYLKGIIKYNIDPKIKLNREKGKLNILDQYQVKKLFSFIKNEKSNPEDALLITLTLIWGLRNIDLAQASIIISKDKMQIKLRRRELTKGKHYHNRSEILTLPTDIAWFLKLQQRYIKHWKINYKKIKKDYPQTPLLLSYAHHSLNFLNTQTVRERLKKATTRAIAMPVSSRVLRQTCGHLHSQSGDASILSILGWSSQFAFHYTWLPRQIVSKS
ncbi:MAG: site-specific integrase [Bacteroidales bacterium]|nr:site-specific integrase [Bacteroidales bacterium]